MAKERTMAWHFVRDNGVLCDGTRLEIGEKIVHAGKLEMCRSGLHASIRAIDALQYAPGPLVCRVAVDGDTLHDKDKLVARERTAIWSYDATEILRLFARQCALEVIDLWDPPDSVRDYLTTGDHFGKDTVWAAKDAAWAAMDARDAAKEAADAAKEAWAGARKAAATELWAARAAARAAALAVEEGAAWVAACVAAREAAAAELLAARAAARKAATSEAEWSASRAAAWVSQNALLESLLIVGAIENNK